MVIVEINCGDYENWSSGEASGGDDHSGGGGSHMTHDTHPIPAAVKSRQSLEIRKVHIENEPMKAPVIDVPANSVPITLRFKSASSSLKVLSKHIPSAGSVQKTSSQDEPHKLYHEVKKPVYQEIREIITPYRRVIQEIRPVQEDIQTVVAQGSRGSGGARSGGGNGGGSGAKYSGYKMSSNSGHSSGGHTMSHSGY